MNTYPDCIVCYLRQVLEALDLNNVPAGEKKEVIFRAADAMRKMNFSLSPFENTGIPHSVVAKMLKIADPYERAKSVMNRRALKIVQKLEKELDMKSSKLSLERVLQLSAVGNLLDYGPPVNKGTDMINKFLYDRNILSEKFKQNVKKLEKILAMENLNIGFLGDNAGEIYFDRFIVEWLSDTHNVTYFVKEKPWINDATLKDAKLAGIDSYASLDTVPVRNWRLELRSKQFLRKLKKFDILIAKGQGNYETLSNENLRCFYLLIAKCKLVAAELGTKQGKIVLEWREM